MSTALIVLVLFVLPVKKVLLQEAARFSFHDQRCKMGQTEKNVFIFNYLVFNANVEFFIVGYN